MDKFSIILNSIDWVFAAIILIGGRYWGSKYFRLSKIDSLNFLGFATAFGVVYLSIIYFTRGIAKNEIANLFITYLVVTSFYELIAQRIFEWIENFIGRKKTVKDNTNDTNTPYGNGPGGSTNPPPTGLPDKP